MIILVTKWNMNNIFPWKTIENDFGGFPSFVRNVLHIFYGKKKFFFIIVCLQALISIFILGDWLDELMLRNMIILMFFLFILSLLRWRGVFNGGSDYMTLQLLLGSLILTAGTSPLFLKTGLCSIAVQSSLSYFISGIVKIKNKSWRNGKALFYFIQDSIFDNRSDGILMFLMRKSWVMIFISWIVIIFECSFPVIFIRPQWIYFYLSFGFMFHLMNIYFLGLNRFFFAWISTYPSLYYCVVSL